MASRPESRIPGPGGGCGGKEKRRSFLPAPKTYSSVPAPQFSSTSTIAPDHPAPPPVVCFKAPVSGRQDPHHEEREPYKEVIPGASHLKISGEVVIGGVKPGILRYVGKTHIAPGFWCGVELFDASGLHDGEVDGKRYFSCKPFHGIFAPLDKVVPKPGEEPVKTKSFLVSDSSQEHHEKKIEKKPEVELKASETSLPVRDPEVESVQGKAGNFNKSQIARLSGIPRIGSADKVVKSVSAESFLKDDIESSKIPAKAGVSRIAAFVRRSNPPPSREISDLASQSSLNSTFVVENETDNRSSAAFDDLDLDSSLDENYTKRVEKKLQSDSRQYFNITFNKESLPGPPQPASNLPDVVSSTSPSPSPPSHGGASKCVTGGLNQTQSAQDIAATVASDISLGLMEPDILLDDTNLVDTVSAGARVASSASESDISLSGNSSTLDEASVATVADFCEGQTSTPLQGSNLRKLLGSKGGGASNVDSQRSEKGNAGHEARVEDVKQTLGETFSVAQDKFRDSDSSSSSGPAFPVKQELLQEEGSNGISPEVSQVLEWDYDHDAFDAKLLEKSQDGMSTSTSDSCSETSVDPLGPLAEKGGGDMELACNEMDESNHFEDNEDGFENIDSIDDFPIGMSKEAKQLMTDSGISEKDLKDFGDQTADIASNRRSVDFEATVVVHSEGETSVGADALVVPVMDENLARDLTNGHNKQERPLSLISTTSADTGYVPDTDSEAGTLTTNSPTEWTEKHQLSGQVVTGHSDARTKAPGSMKRLPSGLPEPKENEVKPDTELYSDTAITVIDLEVEGPSEIDDLDRTACPESVDSEKADLGEGEATDTSSSENEADERPEDDRVEADRPVPGGAGRSVSPAGGTAKSRDSSQSDSVASLKASSASNEMTESAEPVAPPDEDKEESDSTVKEITPTKSDNGGMADFDAKAASALAAGDSMAGKEIKRKDSAVSESLDSSGHRKGKTPARKIVIEHRKVNVKAAISKLADYINAPLSVKPKEENRAESKNKRNMVASSVKSSKQQEGSLDTSAATSQPDSKPKSDASPPADEKKPSPAREEKPKVKRMAPKSKWDNIMSQIEASKDTKVKAKTEVKSSIAAYLSTPVAALPPKKDKEETAKPKTKIVSHAKPDFSNVKSKLSFSASSSSTKRDADQQQQQQGVTAGQDGQGSKVEPTPKRGTPRAGVRMQTECSERVDNWSVVSAASSRTDLSVFEVTDSASPSPRQQDVEKKGNSASRVAPRLKADRPGSVGSSRSDVSAPQRSVKAQNLKNAQKSDTDTNQAKKSSAKSSIPSHNASRLRSKASNQLKSGQPPDVVSTSARGTRAQEVARLESLCEARTKDLNYTRMQLKTGLQAFDAMACLLNYCTQDLNAFSCPEVTAKLKLAEGKITEHQEQIDSLEKQIKVTEQRVLEVVQARDTALEEVNKLKKEIVESEEAHMAALQSMQDSHREAQAKLEETLLDQHQQAIQQLQAYKEKQLERLHDSSRRQISELAAEHQMATNQLRVAHLEEIQGLRNKHDMQMEELHEQHRNKLEDITRRFETIKFCLSEKVESLCQECEDLRFRAKSSEEALQRDADVKVQLALAPYIHLPKEIESLRTVVDMRTEEIQRLRKQNMDLEKQLEELPITQEKVLSLQQKVENLQAIISIKTDHEKQLHEKCQVLMRKYDRESRANKRLSMDYEQAMWRMSQSADFSVSSEGLNVRHLSHSPTRSGVSGHHDSPSPIRRSQSNMAHGSGVDDGAESVHRRQRKISGGDEDQSRRIRCRSATFVMERSKPGKVPASQSSGADQPGACANPLMSRSADYAEMVEVLSVDYDQAWNFVDAADVSDTQSSLESSVILEVSKDFETPSGNLSYCLTVSDDISAEKDVQDEVFDGKTDGINTAAMASQTTLTNISGSSSPSVMQAIMSMPSSNTAVTEPVTTDPIASADISCSDQPASSKAGSN